MTKKLHITIVGAGNYGSRIAEKYRKFKAVEVRAIISRHKPKDYIFLNVPFLNSAGAWKKKFGKPTANDVFDMCIHQNILMDILEDFISIGAKKFILPKPIALNKKELLHIEKLASRHRLKILVASQWHYSKLVEEIGDFVKKNKGNISRADINFSRQFDASRLKTYTAFTAFLPHILQILSDTELIDKKSIPIIESSSRERLRMRYNGKINIHIESDIASQEKTEILKIYLDGDTKVAFVTDFSRVLEKEDVLEKMVGQSVKYFSGISSPHFLTLDTYLPIAKEEIRIVENASKLVVVIGGGVFGTLSALEIAKKGHSVLLIERAAHLIRGASLVNQCRVHLGYHYPRDEKTARESSKAKTAFENFFDRAIVKDLSNHYLVAKEGSLTTAKGFTTFCKKLGLPYTEAWPADTDIVREKIALSVRVPEKIFDANVIREILVEKVAASPTITLLTSAEVAGIKRKNSGFDVTYEYQGKKNVTHCAAIVNAAYGNANHINNHADLPLKEYQYELCEVPIVKTPWKKTGWSVIDGPFFGAMPFGFAKEYLFYDVELSVLERAVGTLPKFKYDIDYYSDKKRTAKRFSEYQKKWTPWVRDVKKCTYLSSMYVVRIVLPKKEKTDTRPTMIHRHHPGFWQMFSGKMTTSVPQAIELGTIVDAFLKGKK